MDKDIIKIALLSKEMGITHKTIYNWVADGRLEIKFPGYVSRKEAWDVFYYMKEKRSKISHFTSSYGITRDGYGRFITDPAATLD
jgi:IS30 family transposase